jgi:ATP-dependent DNA helicase RecQ
MAVPTDAAAPTEVRAVLRDRAQHHLAALVGDPEARLRDDQWTAIEALVADHRRALVVQRTGWGKSAVYFVATALLREAGAGPTVIISPLLALMRNQIDAASRAGIRAVTINSANSADWAAVHEQVHAGEVDVLLVSPERLNNPGFRDEVLPRLAASAGLVVVDEAHCISDWGHDFRPDYRRIKTLLEDLPDGIPVLATTATANARVATDVAEQLGGAEVLVLRGSLERDSLHLGVVQLPSQAARLAWLVRHLPRLEGSGIIYCLTVAATVEVSDHLRANGFEVAAYSGQTDPAERLQIEQDLLTNRVKVVVATSALGMGFDKPDLGFVIHLGAPPSPIAYYQQIGRAGRGVRRAAVLLLPGREDRDIWNYFGSLAFPAERDVRETLAVLGEAGKPLSVPALEPRVSLRRSRLEMMLKVLDVDGAVRRETGGWVGTGRPWVYDADRYQRVEQTRRVEQQAMVEYQQGTMCRLEFLRRALDDPAAEPCGRCDVCLGVAADAEVSDGEIAAAEASLAVPGEPISARAQWPTGMAALDVALSGRIPVDERPEAGRAVGRLDSLGWGTALRELFDPQTPDGDTPVPLRHAAVQVLDAWGAGPFDGVVGIGSATRPQLVEHLAGGLARYLKVPVLARMEAAGDPPRHDVNSARRLAGVLEHLKPADQDAVRGRSVLLVDDRTDTGWTLAVAARLLRRAGATAVFPFALAVG